MKGLLLVERLILESIAKKEKNVEQIINDTSLNYSIVQNTLTFLLIKNIISYKKGIYSVNEESKLQWLANINSKKNMKEEVKELCASLINQYFENEIDREKEKVKLSVKKIWLTASEEKMFNSYLLSLKTFIKNIEKDRLLHPMPEKTGEKKVVFWGSSNYSSLANSYIQAV